jgi:uncharacterized protein (TIGR02147 family)
MADIFEYNDYRALLKALYEENKKEKPFFSYRYIAQKCGFSSAGYFTNIIAGKRNISADLIFKFAELFKLNKRETGYFEALVLYNQAGQHQRKRYYFEKLLSMKKSKIGEIAADQYEYFNKWYYVAIRELLNYYPFRGDFHTLAKQLNPPVSPAEAKKAVELLLRLELIRKTDDGAFELTEKTISTGSSIPLVAIHNFAAAMLDLAKESIDRVPRDKRSISTLTLSLSKEMFDIVNEKFAEFRREVLQTIKHDPDRVDRVYQFNFQIFPLTNVGEESDK